MLERFETVTTKRVAKALDRLQSSGGIMVLSGPHGQGKSTAVQMAMLDRPQVRRSLVTPTGERCSPRGFYQDIGLSLGIACHHNFSAAQMAAEVARTVNKGGLLLALDNAEEMRAVHFSCVRYLADLVPGLVLVGSDALMHKLRRQEAVRTRVRLPIEAAAVTAEELQRFFGAEFSQSFLVQLHEESAGNWSAIWNSVDAARDSGQRTQDFGAEQAASLVEAFVVRAA